MKKPLFLTISIAFFLTMAGCASGPTYKVKEGWVKQDVTYEQSRRDLFYCQEKARSNAERETQVGGLTESCMTLEGYRWGEYKTRIR